MRLIAAAALCRAEPRKLTFGFSLYGMKSLSWRDGIAQIARIGYKSTELGLRSGWDTEPKRPTARRSAAVSAIWGFRFLP